ncbi:MAG: hypothetical protein Q9M94_05500 [Candidatus Gracilibacteria bacterium]|nr:hypothetical protein [Candidatus Gracilibacteria bacterium]
MKIELTAEELEILIGGLKEKLSLKCDDVKNPLDNEEMSIIGKIANRIDEFKKLKINIV